MQNQIPFNPEQPQVQFLNLSLNNPPYVPQWQGDQQLQGLVPVVAAATAIEIQNQAQKNPLRMFMFNQYGQNAFCNPDFDALVTATMDYMLLGLMNRTYMNPEQAAQDSVGKMVEMLCAVNVRLFPGLERYVDPNIMQGIRATVANFDNVATSINSMKQQQSRNYSGGGGGYPNSGGGYPNANWGQPDQRSFGGGGYGNSSMNMGGGNNNWNRSGPVTGGGNVFSGGGNRAFSSMQQERPNMSGTKWGNDGNARDFPKSTSQFTEVKQPFEARKPVSQREEIKVSEQVSSEGKEVLATESIVQWAPSITQPYIPAYNPIIQELYYRLGSQGEVTHAIIKERAMPVMEYERHKLATVFGQPPASMDFSNNVEVSVNLLSGVKNVNTATKAIDDEKVNGDSPEVTPFIRHSIICEASLEAAWFSGEIDRMEAVDGQLPYAYRAYARVATPTISTTDETEFVLGFGATKTFIELRDKLNGCVTDVSSELWNNANRKMTAVVNRVLMQNMSIPELSIDSFVHDIQDLIEYLNTKFGQRIQNAFLKNQKQYISSVFQIMHDSIADGMTKGYLDGITFKGGVEPKITYMSSDYCLTFLNCNSFELELELSKNTSAAIYKYVSPAMYELLEGMFKQSECPVTECPRYLIRTNDGRVMEATVGAIAAQNEGKFYLLTLIE